MPDRDPMSRTPGEPFPLHFDRRSASALLGALPFSARPAVGRYSSSAFVSPRMRPMCTAASHGVSFPFSGLQSRAASARRRGTRSPPLCAPGSQPRPIAPATFRRPWRFAPPATWRCKLACNAPLLGFLASSSRAGPRNRSWRARATPSLDGTRGRPEARLVARPPLLPPEALPLGLGSRTTVEPRLASIAAPFLLT